MKPRLVLSANAVLDRGGQGLNLRHMMQILEPVVDLTIFCRQSALDHPMHFVPESGMARLIGKVPLLRRRRDWSTLLSDVQFDSYVCKHMPESDFFQGVVGQCSQSLKRARTERRLAILDVVNTHIDDLELHVRQECEKFGVHSFIDPLMRKRILQEYADADLIRVMSDHSLQSFVQRGFSPEKLAVVPPPVEVESFPVASFNQSTFQICYVGLLEPWKGFHYLIEAYQSLGSPDTELVFWGGPGARSISRYLARAVSLNPTIKICAQEVRKVGYEKVYGQASVLVHPSLSDGFGYVVAEAMACGIPVIVTKNCGASEYVKDGENGYVIPPADQNAIRERLSYLIENPGKLQKMGQAARAAIKQLTVEASRERYLLSLEALR